MSTAMAADLPLRTSAVWGSFGEVATIPHRYGNVRGKALRYDSSGRRWVWADHASSIITRVRIDGQISSAWSWRNAQDTTGHAVTMIEFSQPVAGEVEAEGVGKIDATTGAVLVNPAAIIADIMTTIAGRATPDLSWLSYEAAKLSIACAGELSEPISLQSAVGAICESIGAIYSPRGRKFARIYPGGLYEGGGADASAESGPTVTADLIDAAESELDGIVNAVVIEFAHRDGKASQTMEVDAPDSIARFGRHAARIEAKWLTDSRVAYAVAARVLTWRAESSWQYAASEIAHDVRTTDVAHFSGSTTLPAPESAIVLAANYDPMTNRSAIEFERLTQHANAIRLVRQSSAIEPAQLTQATVQTVADQRIIRLKTETGEPMANAKVVLNGSVTRYSDAGGIVTFPVHLTPPAVHTLTITDIAGNTTTLSLLIQ